MKRKYFNCIMIIGSIGIQAQVGVNTNSPLSMLDVNGKTTLRKELRVGGTSTLIGNAGLNGQVLVSQGEGLTPVWKSLNISLMDEGQYKLINSYISSDQTGITTLSGGIAGDAVYKSNVGDDITDTSKGVWKKITGLDNTVLIKNEKNRVTYQVQAGVEMKAPVATTSQNVSFTCGVFRDGKLVAVRPDKLSSNNNPEKSGLQDYIFTLNYTELNVPAGNHTVEVACRKIGTSDINTEFSIGRNISNSNTISNAFTLESMIKIDLMEQIIYTAN